MVIVSILHDGHRTLSTPSACGAARAPAAGAANGVANAGFSKPTAAGAGMAMAGAAGTSAMAP